MDRSIFVVQQPEHFRDPLGIIVTTSGRLPHVPGLGHQVGQLLGPDLGLGVGLEPLGVPPAVILLAGPELLPLPNVRASFGRHQETSSVGLQFPVTAGRQFDAHSPQEFVKYVQYQQDVKRHVQTEQRSFDPN